MTEVSQSGFYNTREWTKTRNTYIKLHPLCIDCQKKGRYVEAKYVDHIIPLTMDNLHIYGLDWNNLQSLCAKCHRVKTARSKTTRYSPQNLQRGRELQNKFNDFNNE